MRFARTAGSLLLLSLVLAACSIVVGPLDPFPNATAVSSADPTTAAVAGTLSNNETIVYKVDVSATRSKDLLYAEADQDLDLTVYRADGSVYASSNSADGFSSGLAGLGATVQGMQAQAIGVDVFCRGSCVIAKATTDSVFVKVTNRAASPKNFKLFVFGDTYADTNEPANDSAATAPLVNNSDSGAIETLGDVDYYEMTANGTVRFDTKTTALDIRAYVEDTTFVLRDGETYEALAGDIVRVEVNGKSQAAASAVSSYTLSYLP